MIIKSYSNPFSAYTFYHFFNRKKHPFLFKPGKHLSSHVKPMLVSLISSTHLHNKIYDMAFQKESLCMRIINHVILFRNHFYYRQKTKYTFYIILFFCSKTDKILRGYIFHLEQVIFKFMLIRFIFRMRIQKALKLADHRTPKTIN